MSAVKTILVLIKFNIMLEGQHIGLLVPLAFHWAKTRYLTNAILMEFTFFTQNLSFSLRRREYL